VVSSFGGCTVQCLTSVSAIVAYRTDSDNIGKGAIHHIRDGWRSEIWNGRGCSRVSYRTTVKDGRRGSWRKKTAGNKNS
jgi:hypothetical protein